MATKMSDRIDAVTKATPATGWNLVQVDSFDFDAQPIVLEHFTDEAKANKALADHKSKYPGVKSYLYPANKK